MGSRVRPGWKPLGYGRDQSSRAALQPSVLERSGGEPCPGAEGLHKFRQFQHSRRSEHGRGIAFDANGNLYAVDAWFRRVMIFSPPFQNGMPAAMEFSPAPSGFGDPTGIFIGH
jgi:hypothetical protein